jgi:hypothetical protein
MVYNDAVSLCIYVYTDKKKSFYSQRMPPPGMWRRVDLVWTDASEERIASIFRVENARTIHED